MSGGCSDCVRAFESNTEAEFLGSSSARDRILSRAVGQAAAEAPCRDQRVCRVCDPMVARWS
jgi:hypothetical protein